MSQQVKPLDQLEFLGVYTAGNPIGRPRGTAAKCENFRVMPGNWLRLRSGRVFRGVAGGTVMQMRPHPGIGGTGTDKHLAQVRNGEAVEWKWIDVLSVGTSSTSLDPIETGYDGAFAKTHPVASCSVNDRPVVYNGLGVRVAPLSRPPFTQYLDASPYFFGLDAYCPSGSMPTALLTANLGYNKCTTRLKIYVGLYSVRTEHYSNGVFAGTIGPSASLGTIVVSNLTRLSYAAHNATETASLFYCFYATVDGGEVPYLVLNAALNGPYIVAVNGVSETTLSLAAGTDNGFVLDLTKEMPYSNNPPKPMRTVAYVNGRMYGAPMAGGNTVYANRAQDYASVVWSAAASDARNRDFLGDPLQSWPVFNQIFTPSGDQPVSISPGPDGTLVLVITPSSTFYLEEQADGIHEFTTVSRIHGIANPTTLTMTRHGVVWTDQRNQIVILRPGARSVEVLSGHYQDQIKGVPSCANYILDPVNQIDRYQLWLSADIGGVSVCHDFGVGGQCYTETGPHFTAAMTAVDSIGQIHHLIAKTSYYTHEAQPEWPYPTVTTDDTWDDLAGVLLVGDFDGIYVRNWDDFGDSDLRKEMPHLDIMGDTSSADSIGGGPPLSVASYRDLEQVTPANRKYCLGGAAPQAPASMCAFRYKFPTAHSFWLKLEFGLRGHWQDDAAVYPPIQSEGNLLRNFYGCIVRCSYRIGPPANRQ